MKTLNLNLRRVRSTVRTDVNTGSRKVQVSSAFAYPCAGNTGLVAPNPVVVKAS